MNIFMGYNFLADGNALDPFIASVNNINQVQLSTGIYDHFNVTADVTSDYSFDIPTTWTINTLMDCNFEGNVNAGTLDELSQNISQVKIKRRPFGSFDWITIAVVDIQSSTDLAFSLIDRTASNNVVYEYAFVPVTEGSEGDYVISQILSQFYGVFLCDASTAFKFYAGVNYGDNVTIQRVGTFEPMGRQYPIVVANAATNYQTGSVSGNVFSSEFYDTGTITPAAIVQQKQQLMAFLTNQKPKMLKDWNGNTWLVYITSSPTVSYAPNSGMRILTANAQWAEIGDYTNKQDLYNAGIIPTEN